MKKLRGIVFLSLFFFCIAVITTDVVARNPAGKTAKDLVKEAKAEIKQITPEELETKLDAGESFIIIDVREKDEYDAGHIKGAKLIPRGLLEFKITKEIPQKDAYIIIYCKSGGRGALSTQTLQTMGYTQVYNLKDGFMGWQEYLLGEPAEGGGCL